MDKIIVGTTQGRGRLFASIPGTVAIPPQFGSAVSSRPVLISDRSLCRCCLNRIP